MDDLTLVARRLFDGRSLREGRFCLEARRGLITGIRRIGADDALPKRAVDFGDATLMPGLIDAHCHMARAGQFEAHEPPSLSAVGHNLRAALDAGITTAGDMGSALHLISELRNFLEEDSSAGPALRAAGPILTVPLGYPLDWMSPLHRWLGIAVAIASERDARQAVERIAHAGMDHVKICIMHRAYDLSPLPVFSQKLAAACSLMPTGTRTIALPSRPRWMPSCTRRSTLWTRTLSGVSPIRASWCVPRSGCSTPRASAPSSGSIAIPSA
jgi:hypothetical protein